MGVGAILRRWQGLLVIDDQRLEKTTTSKVHSTRRDACRRARYHNEAN